jgi:rhomboid protease GluP
MYIFLGINVVVFVAMEVTGSSTDSQTLIRFGANYAPAISQGEYWRLLTANFLHIGVLHLLINSYALYILGREVEALYGHPRFVTVYLLTGISGAIFSYMLTQGLSAGASTSLFGLFGALAVFYYKQRKLLGSLGQQRLINLGLILLINVFIGISPGSGIDIWGHVGGLFGGVILSWFLCPVYSLINAPGNDLVQNSIGNTTDLASSQIVDTNTLAKQGFFVGLFTMGLVALTVIAGWLQR